VPIGSDEKDTERAGGGVTRWIRAAGLFLGCGQPLCCQLRPKTMSPMPLPRALVAAASVVGMLAVSACTVHHGAATGGAAGDSAMSICLRHFPGTTVAEDMTVARARFIGGPRPTTPAPGPLDTYPAGDRVVRCLVPLARPTTAITAQVVDVVEPADRAYVRWTQGGSSTQISPVQ
jgi:hypothetical protein